MTNLYNSVTRSTLDEAAWKIAKALISGHLPSVAESVMQYNQLGEMVLELLLKKD